MEAIERGLMMLVLLLPLVGALMLLAAKSAGRVFAAMVFLLKEDDVTPEQIQHAINGLRPYYPSMPVETVRRALRQLEAMGEVRSRLVGERRCYSVSASARARARQWEEDRRAGHRWGFW